jgi:hypothetical protein
MTIAFKPAHAHNYRSSAYERKANDFYPTPSDVAVSLPLGFAKLGLNRRGSLSIRVAAMARSAAA